MCQWLKGFGWSLGLVWCSMGWIYTVREPFWVVPDVVNYIVNHTCQWNDQNVKKNRLNLGIANSRGCIFFRPADPRGITSREVYQAFQPSYDIFCWLLRLHLRLRRIWVIEQNYPVSWGQNLGSVSNSLAYCRAKAVPIGADDTVELEDDFRNGAPSVPWYHKKVAHSA